MAEFSTGVRREEDGRLSFVGTRDPPFHTLVRGTTLALLRKRVPGIADDPIATLVVATTWDRSQWSYADLGQGEAEGGQLSLPSPPYVLTTDAHESQRVEADSEEPALPTSGLLFAHRPVQVAGWEDADSVPDALLREVVRVRADLDVEWTTTFDLLYDSRNRLRAMKPHEVHPLLDDGHSLRMRSERRRLDHDVYVERESTFA